MGALQLAWGSAVLGMDPSCAATSALCSGLSDHSMWEICLFTSSLQLTLWASLVSLKHSKSISTMQTYSEQMNKDLTLHPPCHGRKPYLFVKAFLFGYIYHITFYDVLGLRQVVYLKYILGFWHIWSWVRCGAWLQIRISLTLSLVVEWNSRLGFVFKLNNTRIMQAALVRAQLYLVATWAAEALNNISNTCLTFTSMIRSLVRKEKK